MSTEAKAAKDSPIGPMEARIARLEADKRELVNLLHEFIEVTMGNHSLHWDSTQNYGAGCKQCHKEKAVRGKADELIAKHKEG